MARVPWKFHRNFSVFNEGLAIISVMKEFLWSALLDVVLDWRPSVHPSNAKRLNFI